jgi:inner membrane protein
MAVAETAVQARLRLGASVSASWRSVAWIVAIIASNAPDLDILYASFGGKLGYLEHHRGHTHTLIAVLPLALIALGYAFAQWRWRQHLWDRRDAWWLLALALVCGGLHISMDALNNYGVHPYWPFDNAWYYGDTLFIIEPWVWLLLTPMLAAAVNGRMQKFAFAAICAVGLILPSLFDMQPLGLALAAAGVAAAWWRFSPRLPGLERCLSAIGLTVGLVIFFASTSAHVKQIVKDDAKTSAVGTESVHIVATTLPSNPLCWMIIDVRRTADDHLWMRTGTVTLAREIQAASTCAATMVHQPNLPLQPTSGGFQDSFGAQLAWHGEFKAPLQELRDLNATRCEAHSFLRFARAPAWRVLPDQFELGDLRYDRDGAAGFAEVTISRETDKCPPWPSPWEPPLKAVL